MKLRITLFILVLSVLSNLAYSQQQEITIDFSIQQNGNQLLLDSVLITNETALCDTLIRFPDTSLSVNMISGIEDIQGNYGQNLIVKNAYPNPFSDMTYIDMYCPGGNIEIEAFDTSGRILFRKDYSLFKGIHQFAFYPGAQSMYFISIRYENQEQHIKLLHSGNVQSSCRIRYSGSPQDASFKSVRNTAFTYTEGDNLSFTAYTTACQEVETAAQTGSPTSSESYVFDFTQLTELQPEAPAIESLSDTETSITWNWTDVSVCDGYKYSTENDYATATDIGSLTEFMQDGLNPGTNHQLFVWAYNDCGASFPLEMYHYTTPIPLTQEEIDSINNGTASQAMAVMNIFEQPDSTYLRAQSTNVDPANPDIQLLKDRMHQATSNAVGIAAPQVGINRNLMWVQRWDKGMIMHPWEAYYNPRILQYADSVVQRNDGCLSVPDGGEYPDIEGFSYRAIWIDVEYYTADGTHVIERIDHQYTAHIFQHEIDHLNGIMFFDRQVEENAYKYTIVEGDSYQGLPPID